MRLDRIKGQQCQMYTDTDGPTFTVCPLKLTLTYRTASSDIALPSDMHSNGSE